MGITADDVASGWILDAGFWHDERQWDDLNFWID